MKYNNIIGYIQEGYLTINIHELNDEYIIWSWSNEFTKKVHTSKLRYYPKYDEYKFRIGYDWYSLSNAVRISF